MAAPASRAALEFITVAPTSQHTATVIFLHGLGDTGRGWKPVANMLAKQEGLKHVKWILPHAPKVPVSVNRGMIMPSWFDIFTLDKLIGVPEDQDGIVKSSSAINQLITAEIDSETSPIPANRIVLGGFSQGAALALFTSLTTERKLAGAAALSGWLPLSGKMKSMMSDHARKTPIFMAHGDADPVVQFQYGKQSAELLKTELKFKAAEDTSDHQGVAWHVYEGMGHEAHPKEIKDFGVWLEQVIPASA